MFDTIATAAKEMAGTAGIATGFANLLADLAQINRLGDLARPRRDFGVLVRRVAGQTRQLAIGASRIVTGHAIDVFFRLEIEVGILPAVADMATGTEWEVRGDRDAEVVDHVLLAQPLLVFRVQEIPAPVFGLMHLFGCFGVATQANLGQFRTRAEGLLQLLELAVIRCCAHFDRRRFAGEAMAGNPPGSLTGIPIEKLKQFGMWKEAA
jgi:hypothetical protein